MEAENETSVEGGLTRDNLYKLVWSEPMLKIAARFGVSSSYMARVCTSLNIPRPHRGYWAKLSVGKAPEIPALPEPRPGDNLVWLRGNDIPTKRSKLPKPPDQKFYKHTVSLPGQKTKHVLMNGAKTLFEAGRTSREVGYLKPAKKLLVDVIVTKARLDKALSFANLLFLSLEARGHRVVIAPDSERFVREKVDERERPTRTHHYNNLWSPWRPTVVYVGTVAIGLTLIEMSEEVKVRYVNGEYVRESEYASPNLRGNRIDHSWTTIKEFATGRFCLQAYSPYRTANLVRHWREVAKYDLRSQLATIVGELEQIAVEVARLVEEGERRVVIERERWNAEQARWRQEEAERRAAKALAESKQELLQSINEWVQWQNVESFFSAIEQQLAQLDAEAQDTVRTRLDAARRLFDPGSALDNLKKWKTPEER